MSTVDISEIPFEELSPDYVDRFKYNYMEASSITTYAYSGILKTTDKNIIETLLLSEFPREAADNCLQLFYKELNELYYQSMYEALQIKFSDEKITKKLLQTYPNILVVKSNNSNDNHIGEYLTFFRNKLVKELEETRINDMYESFAVYNFLESLIINGLDNLESFINKPIKLIIKENNLKVIKNKNINDELLKIYKISSIPSYLRKKFIRKYNTEFKAQINSFILNSYIESLLKNEKIYETFTKQEKITKNDVKNMLRTKLLSSLTKDEQIDLEKRLYHLYECGMLGGKNMKKILSDEEIETIEKIVIDEKILDDINYSQQKSYESIVIETNNDISPFNTNMPISLKGFIYPNVIYYIRFIMLERVGMKPQIAHNFLMKSSGKSYDVKIYKSDEKLIEETQKIRENYLRDTIQKRASEVLPIKFNKHRNTKRLLVSTNNSEIIYLDDIFLSSENFFGKKLMELRETYLKKNVLPLEKFPNISITLNEFFSNKDELDWINVKLNEIIFVIKKFKEYLKIKVHDDSNIIYEKEAEFIIGLYSTCLPAINEKIHPIPVDFLMDKEFSKKARKVLWKYVFSIHVSLKKLINEKNMSKFLSQIHLLEEKFKTMPLESRDLSLFPEDSEEVKETKNLLATAFLCLFEKITKFPFGITNPLEIEESDISLVHSILTYNYNSGINIKQYDGENDMAIAKIISTYNRVASGNLIHIMSNSFNILLAQNTIKQRSYMFSQLCKNVTVGKKNIFYQESGKISFIKEEMLDYDIDKVMSYHKQIQQKDDEFKQKILQYQKDFNLQNDTKIDEYMQELQDNNEKQKNVIKFIETDNTIYIPNKNYRELDQDFECNILYNDNNFKSVDHAFQASKFLYKDAPKSNIEYVKIIQESQTSGIANKYGNFSQEGYNWLGKESLKRMNNLIDEYKNKVTIMPDWEKKNKEIMKNILLSKFSLNENCRKSLLNTYKKNIVYLNKNDIVFGVNSKNKGENILGKLLFDIRQEYELL